MKWEVRNQIIVQKTSKDFVSLIFVLILVAIIFFNLFLRISFARLYFCEMYRFFITAISYWEGFFGIKSCSCALENDDWHPDLVIEKIH